MKSQAHKIRHGIALIAVVTILLFITACSPSGNQPPTILAIKADTLYVYPRGQVELECLASDPEGDSMIFTWSCANGTFVGSGPITTWQAPNAYGDFPIMIVVEDSNGNSSKAILTIGVVVNESQQGCNTCP